MTHLFSQSTGRERGGEGEERVGDGERGDPQKGLTAPFLCENNVTALRNLALEFAKFLVFSQKAYA